jgi:trimeric autotransporter adhesin
MADSCFKPSSTGLKNSDMKKVYILLIIMSFLMSSFSQNLGIGTNNPQNKLHVAGGLRLDTLVGVNGSGLLKHDASGAVFGIKFTGNISDVLRGDGTFGAGGGTPANVWMLNGNAGTNPATDFFGTTDAQPLLFRVNNFHAGIIHPVNSNTAFGYKTLVSNTGFSNTAIGSNVLYSNTTGYENVASGSFALYSNTIGAGNTATGVSTLQLNTTGSTNTAMGVAALYANTTGSNNTANGGIALFSNTTGSNNTANGFQALRSNTTGSYNTAYGAASLYSNTTGGGNTAYGNTALYNNNTGYYNTALGYEALYFTFSSQNNTAIGYAAGRFYNNGWNNVFVGASADVNGHNYFNVVSIGQGAVCTAPSQVTIGNSSTNSYRAYAGWTNISDGRYKKNVKEDIPGLAFINKLRPVTYTLDATGLDNFLHRNQSPEKQTDSKAKEMINVALNEKEQIRFTGFIAQEVEKSAKESGFNFSGVDAPKNENDVYGLRYSEFVVPLVKAVQEQQAIIVKQQKQIDELNKKVDLIFKNK